MLLKNIFKGVMMSIQIEELVKLLYKEPVNLSISGAWGVGKTYLWKEVSQKLQSDNKKEVLYMSLYNISSIDDLYTKISLHSVTNKVENENFSKIKPFINSITEVFSGDKFKNTLKHVTSNFLKDQIICFDDIERATKDFDATDFLSFISHLKEDKSCSVVLILNEDQIKDIESFNLHREKCIDHEIYYRPTTEENVEKVFDKSDTEAIFVTSFFKKVKVNNIRLFQRVKFLISQCKADFLIENSLTFNDWTRGVLTLICLYVYLKYDSERQNKPSFEALFSDDSDIEDNYLSEYTDSLAFSSRLSKLILGYLDGAQSPFSNGFTLGNNFNKPDHEAILKEKDNIGQDLKSIFLEEPTLIRFLELVSSDYEITKEEISNLYVENLLKIDFDVKSRHLPSVYALFQSLKEQELQDDVINKFVTSHDIANLKRVLTHSRMPHDVKRAVYVELMKKAELHGKVSWILDVYQKAEFSDFDFHLLNSLDLDDVSLLVSKLLRDSSISLRNFVGFLKNSIDNHNKFSNYIHNHDKVLNNMYLEPINEWRLGGLRNYIFNRNNTFRY